MEGLYSMVVMTAPKLGRRCAPIWNSRTGDTQGKKKMFQCFTTLPEISSHVISFLEDTSPNPCADHLVFVDVYNETLGFTSFILKDVLIEVKNH